MNVKKQQTLLALNYTHTQLYKGTPHKRNPEELIEHLTIWRNRIETDNRNESLTENGGIPRRRRLEEVEADSGRTGLNNWIRPARKRSRWRQTVKTAKVHKRYILYLYTCVYVCVHVNIALRIQWSVCAQERVCEII